MGGILDASERPQVPTTLGVRPRLTRRRGDGPLVPRERLGRHAIAAQQGAEPGGDLPLVGRHLGRLVGVVERPLQVAVRRLEARQRVVRPGVAGREIDHTRHGRARLFRQSEADLAVTFEVQRCRVVREGADEPLQKRQRILAAVLPDADGGEVVRNTQPVRLIPEQGLILRRGLALLARPEQRVGTVDARGDVVGMREEKAVESCDGVVVSPGLQVQRSEETERADVAGPSGDVLLRPRQPLLPVGAPVVMDGEQPHRVEACGVLRRSGKVGHRVVLASAAIQVEAQLVGDRQIGGEALRQRLQQRDSFLVLAGEIVDGREPAGGLSVVVVGPEHRGVGAGSLAQTACRDLLVSLLKLTAA